MAKSGRTGSSGFDDLGTAWYSRRLKVFLVPEVDAGKDVDPVETMRTDGEDVSSDMGTGSNESGNGWTGRVPVNEAGFSKTAGMWTVKSTFSSS